MAVDERARRHLHDRLSQTLGPDAADTLMDELHSLGRDQLVTKHDLELSKAATREEFTRLRGEMREEFAAVRGEMHAGFAAVRGEMREEFAAVRGEMHAGFAAVRGEMREEFATVRGEMDTMRGELVATFEQRIGEQTRQLGIWMLGSLTTLAALAFGAAAIS